MAHRKHAHFLLALIQALCTCAFAQQVPLDTLRATWNDTALPPGIRVPALAQWLDRDSTLALTTAIGSVLPPGSDTSAAVYARQRGLALLAQGSAHAYNGRAAEALRYSRSAVKLLERVGHPVDLAVAHGYLGRQSGQARLSGEEVQHYMHALQLYETLKDTTGMLAMNSALAYSYSMQEIDQRSIGYYQRNLDLVRGKRPDVELDIMVRIANRYKSLGDIAATHTWLDSASHLMRTRGAVDRERSVNWMRGNMYLDEGRCKEALEQFQLCLEVLDTQPENQAGKSWMRSRVAMAHNCAEQYTLALRWANEGLAMADAHGLRKEMLDNLYPLATAYEGLGDTRMALRYYKRYHALLDSLINTEAASKLTDAALTNAFEKEQLADSLLAVQRTHVADAVLAKERSRRNLLLIIGAFGVAFGIFSYRQSRRTRRALHRSDELLLNILPEEVAHELKDKGRAEAEHFDNVTILFTDFKGFTEASEKLSPQELVEELNTCFSAFDHIMAKHGIEKIKTIGDAYMAAGGLPTPNTTHALDVVKAALEIRDFIAEGKARKVASGLPYFEIRIGIHTGPVVAGIVGVKKFAYDIWGDTVNTASRMESSGEVGQVNISEATYALVKNEAGLTFTSRGKVRAKGKGEMEMYFVSGSFSEG
ncbi:MAG: hypothetical protein IPO12_17385 [Flavobacteriales bacterium]|nr:hypothetical protein [Flavobacteriales bacterium]